MLKFSYLIIIIVLFHCLAFCERSDKSFDIKIINSFSDTLDIEGRKTTIKDEEVLSSLRLYDSILVFSLYPSSDSPYLYRAYNIHTEKCLGDFLAKGRGPDEFSDQSFILTQAGYEKGNEIKIWIKEFPAKIVLLNLTKTLLNRKTAIEQEYNFIRPGKANMLYKSGATYVINEKIMLLDINVSRSRNADNMDRSFFYYIMYDYFEDACLDTLKYCYDLSGWAALNKEKTKIVRVSYWEDIISLYDIANKKETVLCHTRKLPDELYGLENNTVKKPEYIYRTCFFSGNLVFTLYQKNDLDNPEGPAVPSQVHIFDTAGTPLYNLRLQEPVENICFDDGTRILYGLDAEGQLYGYDLKDILK